MSREEVREHYAQVAAAVSAGQAGPGEGSCCSCGDGGERLYPADVRDGLPVAALRASRGCGNPLGQIELEPGMRVLDLGSGGGIDCLIAAAEVGPQGRVWGLDMTDEMLELANENKRVAGAENVEFVKGFIEDIPLPDGLVDVVSSNCVINLSADKPRVLAEAHRVLRPGGTFLVADIIALEDEFSGVDGLELARVFGCRSGVVTQDRYRRMMETAGFSQVQVRVYKRYSLARVREKAEAHGMQDVLEPYTDEQLADAFGGAFVSGVKED